jgi:hypothetical protein
LRISWPLRAFFTLLYFFSMLMPNLQIQFVPCRDLLKLKISHHLDTPCIHLVLFRREETPFLGCAYLPVCEGFAFVPRLFNQLTNYEITASPHILDHNCIQQRQRNTIQTSIYSYLFPLRLHYLLAISVHHASAEDYALRRHCEPVCLYCLLYSEGVFPVVFAENEKDGGCVRERRES